MSKLYNLAQNYPKSNSPLFSRTSSSVEVFQDIFVKVKADLSGLFDTDAYWHILSLPLTEFTPSPEALHTKQA
jgi:hypothetical protein